MDIPKCNTRKALAATYMEMILGEPIDEALRNAVDGDNENPSRDYYIGAERMISNTMIEIESLKSKFGDDIFKESLQSFSMMMGYVSFQIENLSSFGNE